MKRETFDRLTSRVFDFSENFTDHPIPLKVLIAMRMNGEGSDRDLLGCRFGRSAEKNKIEKNDDKDETRTHGVYLTSNCYHGLEAGFRMWYSSVRFLKVTGQFTHNGLEIQV